MNKRAIFLQHVLLSIYGDIPLDTIEKTLYDMSIIVLSTEWGFAYYCGEERLEGIVVYEPNRDIDIGINDGEYCATYTNGNSNK